ncbi:MAG: hypothetical protein L0287_07875 [Anaerolineae bacterium]|nr:hypothetical protein [Anaerolineae bacterium]
MVSKTEHAPALLSELTSEEFRLIRSFRKLMQRFKPEFKPGYYRFEADVAPGRVRSRVIPKDQEEWDSD